MRLFYSTVADETMAVPPDGSLAVEEVVGNRARFIRKCGVEPVDVTALRLGRTGNDRVIRVQNGNRHTIHPDHAVRAEALVMDIPLAIFVAAADCPIVSVRGQKVGGVAHNGWRGAIGVPIDAKSSDNFDNLKESIVEELVRAIRVTEGTDVELRAWISPAVCARHYTVHEDVARFFLLRYPEFVELVGVDGEKGPLYSLDLRGITEAQLRGVGITRISGSKICTFQDENLFSDRGSKQGGQPWGRMGVLVVAD
jgi:copper oxidase (laccase) domain-containing protein